MSVWLALGTPAVEVGAQLPWPGTPGSGWSMESHLWKWGVAVPLPGYHDKVGATSPTLHLRAWPSQGRQAMKQEAQLLCLASMELSVQLPQPCTPRPGQLAEACYGREGIASLTMCPSSLAALGRPAMEKGMHLFLSDSSVPGWKMGNRFPGGTPGTGQPWGHQTWDFWLNFTSLTPQFVVSTEEARSRRGGAVSLGCHLRDWWAQGIHPWKMGHSSLA